ncbi:MAG: ABC transporter substrate-binding protein [Chitinivibrionales bacterium]|nr:ABC transporter substrate-binding protein [Chitinivibrionales bacterium]MBD3397087.1 ABC transporter substrate-binding protein [Chitinivibrionales bacterium]
MSFRFQFFPVVVLFALLLVGCGGSPEPGGRIAFTSILPHRSVARRIAGDRFEVYALVGPGQSPHSFSPTPGQMTKLAAARVFFGAGIAFEEGVVPKIRHIAPRMEIIDLRQDIALREAEDHAGHDAAHAHEGHDHHEHGSDPHIWLSPPLMKRQAATIKDALVKADPAGQSLYEKNFGALAADLDSLDAYLREILGPYEGADLFVFHPAFGYFADAYGLRQVPVETGGKEPGARALARLVDKARAQKPAAIFVQPQFSQKSARAVAGQVGCPVVHINPLPEKYLQEMRRMGETVRQGLRAR